MQLRFLFAALAVLASALSTACGPVAFAADLTGTATVPGGDPTSMLAALPLVAMFSNLDFDENADFKSNDVTRTELRTVKAQSVEVKVTQPAGADLAFLDSLQLVAKSGDTETVFAEATGIAMTQPVPDTLTVPLTDDIDITAQVAQSPMSFIMRGKGRQPKVDTQLTLQLSLSVQSGHR